MLGPGPGLAHRTGSAPVFPPWSSAPAYPEGVTLNNYLGGGGIFQKNLVKTQKPPKNIILEYFWPSFHFFFQSRAGPNVTSSDPGDSKAWLGGAGWGEKNVGWLDP
eukprot:EG_transcript_31644